MSRLKLAQVTLCAVDTRSPALAAQSLLLSMKRVEFARVLLFTDDWLPAVVLPGIDIVQIEPLRSAADYSHFVLRLLPAYIRTSHVLVTQWDGFVTHPEAWSDEFLVHDYIGAVWDDQPEGRNVGNGGFSLRSRRFMAAGQDPRIVALHPEDLVMCRDQRDFLQQVHGISFAPPVLARRFAYENEPPQGHTFGFHGPYNLPAVLDEQTLAEWMRRLPDGFFVGRDGRRLVRALVLHGMPDLAWHLVQRRRASGKQDLPTTALGIAARASSLARRMWGTGPAAR